MEILSVDSSVIPANHITKNSVIVGNNSIPNEVSQQSSWQDNVWLYLGVGILITVIGGLILKLLGIIDVRHRTITVSHKTKEYVSKYNEGSVSFDYSNNNGYFTLGSKDYEFTTCWSKASNSSIHAYNDAPNIECIGLMKNVEDLKKLNNIEVDFSSRCRTAHIGEVIVWKNKNGHLAATKILRIKDDSRGDDSDLLEFEYVIYK